jgi:hypothetical protein
MGKMFIILSGLQTWTICLLASRLLQAISIGEPWLIIALFGFVPILSQKIRWLKKTVPVFSCCLLVSLVISAFAKVL